MYILVKLHVYKSRINLQVNLFLKILYKWFLLVNMNTYHIKRKIPVEKLYKSTPTNRYTYIRVNIL